MPDMNDFARMLKEVSAGRPAAADHAASNDPYLRVLRKSRPGSTADDLVSIKNLAAELGKFVRIPHWRNTHPDAFLRIKCGRCHMYRRADVQRWLDSRARTPADGGNV